MRAAVKNVLRRAVSRRGGDRGFAIVLVGLLLIFFMIVAAIIVDLGDARQQKRQASAAADAGALAGAEALAFTTHGSGCPDASCEAAYYTLSSSNLKPSSAS